MTKAEGGPGGGAVNEVMRSLSPSLIFRRFAKAWPSFGLSEERSTPAWTRALLDWFRQEGKVLGFQVYPDPDAEWHSEYLNDLCWCIEEDWTPRTVAGVIYHGLVLALESEWDQSWDEMLDDFDRLLDVKAPLKVFICDPTGPQLDIFADRISNQIGAHMHQTPSEHYLVIAFGPRLISAWSFDQAGAYLGLGTIPY